MLLDRRQLVVNFLSLLANEIAGNAARLGLVGQHENVIQLATGKPECFVILPAEQLIGRSRFG